MCTDRRGEKFAWEEDCVSVNSEDDDASTSQKKSKKRSQKQKSKAVMAVERLDTPSTGKKAKAEAPGKEAAMCTDCRDAAAAKKAGKGDGPYCKIHRTRGHDLQ